MILTKNLSINLKLLLVAALPFFASTLSAKTYVTEEKVQIDRCACAWFISRFLDENPKFVFIKQGQKPPEGITYDFFGADYFHKGPDCSFTAFIKKHIKKKNSALIAVNAIVNDVFAWRNGPNSLSVAIKKHIDHLADSGKTDEQIYQECLLVFDLLYLKKGGNTSDMHRPGAKATAGIELTLIQHIYPPANQLDESLQKAAKQDKLNSETLMKILQSRKSSKKQSLYALTAQILK